MTRNRTDDLPALSVLPDVRVPGIWHVTYNGVYAGHVQQTACPHGRDPRTAYVHAVPVTTRAYDVHYATIQAAADSLVEAMKVPDPGVVYGLYNRLEWARGFDPEAAADLSRAIAHAEGIMETEAFADGLLNDMMAA